MSEGAEVAEGRRQMLQRGRRRRRESALSSTTNNAGTFGGSKSGFGEPVELCDAAAPRCALMLHTTTEFILLTPPHPQTDPAAS